MKLSNKRILISGGSKGIGREIVMFLLARDAHVTSISRTPSGINHSNLTEIKMDLCKIQDNFPILPGVLSPSYDILINNVGYNPGLSNFSKLQYDQIATCLSLNVTVHVFLTRFTKFRKVVFINSMLGLIQVPENAMYCASKAFINSFAKTLRLEGVDTLVVYPAKVDTGMFDQIIDFMVLKKKAVAQAVVTGISRDTRIIRLPFYIWILELIETIVPTVIYNYFGTKLYRLFKKK